jgi:diguanylate cyclase (GGDEF)-like protein/putative nucleotidyltransferase with HDIG domain
MENPSFIHKREEYLDRVSKSTTDIRLLARHHSLEVMKQKIAESSTFHLYAPEDWEGFEFIYVIRGELAYTETSPPLKLEAGDYISRQGIEDESWFETKTDVSLLYLSSQPAFHLMRQEIEDYLQLAEEIESTEQMDGHSKRLLRMSHEIGKRLGLDSKELTDLKYAAFFHDLGKARVPDRILEKEGSLTDEEWEIMEKHTIWGREMLEGAEKMDRVGKIVEQSHERVDGGGYPGGLSGDEIMLEARIITVVDSWDAMRSDRPYRDALSQQEAIAELKDNRGTQFDPEVVETFLEVLEEEGKMHPNTGSRSKYKDDVTHSHQSEKLFRFSQEIRSAESIERVVESTLDAIVESTVFRRALVSIFDRPIDPGDPEPARVKHYDHRGLDEEDVKALEDNGLEGVKVDHQKFDPAYKLSESYYVPHEEREEKFDTEMKIESKLGEEETLNWHPDDSLYVPLYRKDKIIGQISVDDPEHGLVPDPESLQPIESFASISSMGVENAGEFESGSSGGDQLDSLTGLYSRGYFNKTVQEEMNKGERYAEAPATLLMFDLSGLREVNSRHSHLTGDEVLIEIAGILKENFSSADLIVRYGDDEFLLVFPDSDETGDELEDRLKGAVTRWNSETNLISVEIGVEAVVLQWEHGQGKEIKDLLHDAERELSPRG